MAAIPSMKRMSLFSSQSSINSLDDPDNSTKSTDSQMRFSFSAKGDSDKEMRLSTNMPMNHTVRILPGKSLSSKIFLPLGEIDRELERNSSDAIRSSNPQSYDILEIPLTPRDFNMNLNVNDIGKVKHLCNGSRSHLFKGQYEEKCVILKVMIDAAVGDKLVQREFKMELEVLRRFHHPNILDIYGAGQIISRTDASLTRPFLVLESLNGDTLAYHLSKKRSFHSRPFTPLRYLRMAREFIDALRYIHTLFHPDCIIIHRDLKPDNIGFTSDGTLKLLDFGLCTTIRRGSSNEGYYHLSGCTGSLRYMAPEVAMNKKYNEKVDIYGYGLIVYEMITGVTPFDGYNKEKFYERVVYRHERPGFDYDDYGREVRVHEDIQYIISRCWDVKVENRPSAVEIYDILEQVERHTFSFENEKSFLRRSFDRVFSKKDTI